MSLVRALRAVSLWQRLTRSSTTLLCGSYGDRGAGLNGRGSVPSRSDIGPRFSSAANEDEQAVLDPPEQSQHEPGPQVVYEGPFPGAVRGTKILSVSSCFLTTVGSPLLAIGEPSVRGFGLAIVFMLFGFGTTSALHYLVKPYVRRISFDYASQGHAVNPQFGVERLSFFGRSKWTTVRAAELEQPTKQLRPMCNLYAGKVPLFVEFDLFEDKQLLKTLLSARTVASS
ncbi:hypothetical protein FVE85_1503 [Porphyridium purpureum]|uniref:Transmembrane protein n=1 Tax=Porphyridium purpureum TaxID=35688 RepID=A0A5J4YVZ1_PORPP|nr:hypothetical protein FVE85_1503 [Porphyridium purpureum]|eukprot:POR5432..scf209_3